jgi:hypothetical protein
MRSVLVALVVLGCLAGRVRAEPGAQAGAAGAVALLPLDADQQLAIYGQPVASELARALGAGGVEVVVVGPQMAVPPRARLIVDGTIQAKGEAVVLSVRVRDPRDGTVLATVEATAPKLTSIDKAAAQLSARVLPAVTGLLAKQREAHPVAAAPAPVPPPAAAVAAPASPMLVEVITAPGAAPSAGPLRAALAGAVDAWAAAHHRAPTPADTAALANGTALAAHHGTLGVLVEVEAYTVEPGLVPLARARVHVRVVQAGGPGAVAFDRVIVTDTVVGDRGLSADALAARTAREVLAIAEPHVRRVVASWR